MLLSLAHVVVTACVSFSANASNMQVDLKTPRGSTIKVDVYNPGAKRVMLLAQGQGCNARLEMYDAIAREAKADDFTLVRLYWAYCVTEPKGEVSEDLSLENEDLLTALEYVRTALKFDDTKIFIGGKSLGSLVSFDIFSKQKSLQALVLLTPVCTDSTDPAATKNAFDVNYPGLAVETRPVLVTQGDVDLLCEAKHFQEYLQGKPASFSQLVVPGDHGFGLKNPDGSYDTALAAKNLDAISRWIFTELR